jgi:hypothetical protein
MLGAADVGSQRSSSIEFMALSAMVVMFSEQAVSKLKESSEMLLVEPPSKKDSDPEKLKKPSENQRDWNGSPTNFSLLPQTDFDWDQLIAAIQLGSVIPVVGKDLLQIEMLGRAMKVDSYLAGELARAFGFTPEELPFSPDLADVICSKPELCAKLVKNAQAIYSKVASVYETKIKKNPNFPVPCALQKLAEIPRFSFFLSLTCDDLLHQALESARGQPPVRIDNERKGTPDITEEQLKSGRPVVYRLFGRFAHWGDYALTEEDMLEFMHWLPERAYRPEKPPSRKSNSRRFCPDGRPRQYSGDERSPLRVLHAKNEAVPIHQ